MAVSNKTNFSWGGFGITLFDSLDTMLVCERERRGEARGQTVTEGGWGLKVKRKERSGLINHFR